MLIVAIATRNEVKSKAIKEAFEKVFQTEVKIILADAKSEVNDQPIDEDVSQGATNRLINLKKMVKNESVDYFVSCEGGLVEVFGQYYNVQYTIVEQRKTGCRSQGISQGYPIPTKYMNQIIFESANIAQILDQVFDGKGGVRQLTNGARTREHLIAESTIMALTGLVNREKWAL